MLQDESQNNNFLKVRAFATKETMPYEIALWMCFVAFILLGAYVKITMALELHWVFVIYSVSLATLILGRYVFFMLYSPALIRKGKYNPEVNAIITSWNESKKVYLTVKSLVRVSCGETSAVHQVISIRDDDDVVTVQYPFVSAGSTTGIGTFGGEISGDDINLRFYPRNVQSY